jgi:hypothetical protein
MAHDVTELKHPPDRDNFERGSCYTVRASGASGLENYWMNLQLRWDLHQAQQAERDELESIRTHAAASR